MLTTHPLPERGAAPGAVIALAVLACVPYGLMLAILYAGPPGGDPSSYGGEGRIAEAYAALYAMIFGFVLWVVLGILTLLAARSGVPRWAGIGAGIAYPISVLAAFFAGEANFGMPGGWSILVPALLPPLIAGYAIWLRVPALRAKIPAEAASKTALGAIALVCAATIPLGLIDELQMPARVAAYQKQNEAIGVEREAYWAQQEREKQERYARLTPDSPLQEHLDYVFSMYNESPGFEKAVEGARQAKSRQADALKLLQAERPQLYGLQELWRLDLQVTPDLCKAYDIALYKEAVDPDTANWNEGEYLEYQIPNIKFFIAGGCDLDNTLGAAEARVRLIIEPIGQQDPSRQRWSDTLAALTALRGRVDPRARP